MMAVGLCPHLCLVLSHHSPLSLVPTHPLLAPGIFPHPLWGE